MFAAITLPPLDPVALEFGPFAIRWYGLAYLASFVLGYWMLRAMAKSERLRVPVDFLPELIAWLVAGVMLGGRLGWWVFYHRSNGVEPWYEPVAIWHGGMSFHGGLAGLAVALLIWCRRRSQSFWNAADCLALVAPVGLFLGRIANFINAELVGRPAALPWAVVFPGEEFGRHPSQLYEAMLEGPLLLACLWVLRRLRVRDGEVAALFLILYGVSRFLVEFTRQPDPQLGFVAFGWLTMGQLLSVVIVLAGVVVIAARRRWLLDDPTPTQYITARECIRER